MSYGRFEDAQVGPAVTIRRGRQCEEDDVRSGNRLVIVGVQRDEVVGDRTREQLLQARLVDRQFAFAQLPQAPRVRLPDPNRVPEVSEAGGLHESDITGADDRDIHDVIPNRKRPIPSSQGTDASISG